MCLIINHRNLKTASKDITVYKLLIRKPDGDLYAPYMTKTKYEENKLFEDPNEPEVLKSKTNTRIAKKGFVHSCRTVKSVKARMEDYCTRNEKFIKHFGWKVEAHRATIPKGSKYYEGKCNDICSRSIVILEEITE